MATKGTTLTAKKGGHPLLTAVNYTFHSMQNLRRSTDGNVSRWCLAKFCDTHKERKIRPRTKNTCSCISTNETIVKGDRMTLHAFVVIID